MSESRNPAKYKVLVRQSACPKKSLSIFFYAKQFTMQRLGDEKLGMNKLKELTLSTFHKPWASTKLLDTADSSGQIILVSLLTLEKLKFIILPLLLALGKS